MDRIDHQIIALLRENARRSFQDIGSRVSLSAPAVKRRVDRMETEGVITGYAAIVDPSKLGWNTMAVVELYCDGRMPGTQVKANLEHHEEVVSAYTVAGESAAVVLLRARDTEHLERTLEAIREPEGVISTQTQVVLSALIERPLAASA
jgi:DNA-binding Lrp family transcriptional regulator